MRKPMDILCFGRSPDLVPWEGRPFSPGVETGPRPTDKRDNHERAVGMEPPGPPVADGPHRRAARALLAFDVFPPRLLTGVVRRAPVEPGDAVGVLYHFLPGMKLFFASRVLERFDEEREGKWRTGFSYRTLAGHPETGEETFCVEKDLATGKVVVALRSWSRPGIWLSRWLYPLTRRWQLQAGRLALDHLEAIARSLPA